MKSANAALPVVRVTRGAKTSPMKPQPPLDMHVMNSFVKIIEHLARIRARVDGTEARLKYLETLLESKGIR
jgi:hypothetical protein